MVTKPYGERTADGDGLTVSGAAFVGLCIVLEVLVEVLEARTLVMIGIVG